MNRVKELRIAMGCTQEQLAIMLEISRTYLSQIENNKRIVSYIIMTRIANLFNLTVEEIFFVNYC